MSQVGLRSLNDTPDHERRPEPKGLTPEGKTRLGGPPSSPVIRDPPYSPRPETDPTSRSSQVWVAGQLRLSRHGRNTLGAPKGESKVTRVTETDKLSFRARWTGLPARRVEVPRWTGHAVKHGEVGLPENFSAKGGEAHQRVCTSGPYEISQMGLVTPVRPTRQGIPPRQDL